MNTLKNILQVTQQEYAFLIDHCKIYKYKWYLAVKDNELNCVDNFIFPSKDKEYTNIIKIVFNYCINQFGDLSVWSFRPYYENNARYFNFNLIKSFYRVYNDFYYLYQNGVKFNSECSMPKLFADYSFAFFLYMNKMSYKDKKDAKNTFLIFDPYLYNKYEYRDHVKGLCRF